MKIGKLCWILRTIYVYAVAFMFSLGMWLSKGTIGKAIALGALICIPIDFASTVFGWDVLK